MAPAITVKEPPKHLRSNYDFQLDLPWAKKREMFAAKQIVLSAEEAIARGDKELALHLAGSEGDNRFEVKAERKAFETGNCFIEYARVKRLGRSDTLTPDGDGAYLFRYAVRQKDESGRFYYPTDEQGQLMFEEYLIKEGDERFKVETDNKGNLVLIEWSGIRASTAEFFNIVLGRAMLTVPRKELLEAMREKWRRDPSAHKVFSGDNGATRGVVMRVEEVALCANGDLLEEDISGIKFA